MTLPSLIGHYRKKELHTLLKKAYSDLSQVNMRIIADGSSLSEITGTLDRAKLIMSYFNGKVVLGNNTDWHVAALQLTKIYDGKGLYSHTNNQIYAPLCDNGGIWADNNGRFWLFNDSDSQICVDINGKKGPNRYGYDFFIFYPNKKGQILPHYTDKENEYNYEWTNMKDYTYYALNDIHPSDPNKTYWKDYINLK